MARCDFSFTGRERFFQGHFPGCPVLPGVIQLLLARDAILRHFGTFPERLSVRRLKFRKIVRPGVPLTLSAAPMRDGAFSFALDAAGERCSAGTFAPLADDAAEVVSPPLPPVVAVCPASDVLPHRPPMVVLRGEVGFTEDGCAVAQADVSGTSPLAEASVGAVPGCAALEYMAQTAAAAVGWRDGRAGRKPGVGVVLGTRRMSVRLPFFEVGADYRVTAKCVYEDAGFGAFDCRMTDGGGREVAAATLSAYRPDDAEGLERLKEMP